MHRRGDLIAIGAGKMSPYFLFNTIQDPTQFIAYQCETETEEAFPVPDDKTKIKFMTSYCNDLFIFILEDNKFYIRKSGSEACGLIITQQGSNIDQKFIEYNKIWVLNKEYDDQEVSLGPWHAFITENGSISESQIGFLFEVERTHRKRRIK
ncbi:hypothetical protein C9374_005176 [Naegleria lovaniensis]|uniref:Uncharacterized protein n=1 Tax=Naegleria lovaniensis TaxID=51637 RepID=A0AA88KNI3_NAELO|nr:uncharacterized protein C9374_005176 [Naegleria lovaniensis]KAG2382596.1 hypothetical protein C9374_005176 [Naegleria lovaniensis]